MSLFGGESHTGLGKRAMGNSILSSAEHQLFSVIYFLQKDTRFHNIFYVTAFIQFVHTLQNAFVEDTFPWGQVMDDSYFRILLRYLTMELFIVTETAFYVFFVIVNLMVIAIVTMGVYMARSLHRGTVPPQSLSRALQFLVGVAIAFEIPITRILLAEVECDYGHTGRNPYWKFQCFDTPGRLLIYIFSMFSLLVFMAVVLVASLMHSVNPKSQDPTSRANTKTDMFYSAFQMSTVVVFRLAWRHPVWLSLWYLLGSLILLTAVTMYQPFFWTNMNAFRCAIHAGTAWTGFCVLLVSIVDNHHSSVLSTMYLSLLLPCMVYCWKYSKRFLDTRIQEGKSQVVDEDRECFSSDQLLDHLRQREEDTMMHLTSWEEQKQAAWVEIRTRFLLTDDSPEAISKADKLLRAGLKTYPNSESLLLKYILFVGTYKQDDILANAIVNHCRRLTMDDVTVRFEIFRLQKDMQRMRQLGARHGRKMDVISFEETQKTLRMGKYNHMRARVHIEGLLRDIAKDKTTNASILRRIEIIYRNENAALEHYDTLLSRGTEHKEALLSFSCFLRDVMLDENGAEAILNRFGMDKAEQGGENNHSEVDGSENQKSLGDQSGVSSTHGREFRLNQLTSARDERLTWLTWRMRIVTLLLFCIMLGVFLLYFFLTKRFENTLLNLNDSGARSALVILLTQFGQCYRANMITGGNATGLICKASVDQNLPVLRQVHQHLMQTYATTYPDQLDLYYKDQTLLTISAPNGTEQRWYSGAQMMDQFISSVEIFTNASYTKVTTGFNASRADSWPEYYFIVENAVKIARTMDSSTVIYQQEAMDLGYWIEVGIVVSVCVAGAVEIAVVLLMFRPAVESLFVQFSDSINRAKSITNTAARAALYQMRKAQNEDDEEEDLPKETTKGDGADEEEHSVELSTTSSRAQSKKMVNRSGSVNSKHSTEGNLSRGASAVSKRGMVINLTPALDTSQGTSLARPLDLPAIVRPSDGEVRLDIHEAADARPSNEANTPLEDVDEEPEVNSVRSEENNSFHGGRANRDETEEDDSDDDAKSNHNSVSERAMSVADENGMDKDEPNITEPIELPASPMSTPRGLLQLPVSPSSKAGSPLQEFGPNKLVTFNSGVPTQKRRQSKRNITTSSDQGYISSDSETCSEVMSLKEKRRPKILVEMPLTIDAQAEDNVADDPIESTTDGTGVGCRKLSRKHKLQLLYTLSLLIILGALIAFAVRGYTSVNSSKLSAVELTNASRHRYLSRYMTFMGLELRRQTGNTSLFNGVVSGFVNETVVKCQLSTVAHAAKMVHDALLYGEQQSWNHLAERRGWEHLHHDTPCSPLTPHKDLFLASRRTPGSINRWKPTSDLLFEPSCMATLPWANEGSHISENPRIKYFTKTFNNLSDCVQFNKSDPYMMHGFHTLFEYLTTNGELLAQTPAAQITLLNPRVMAHITYELLSKEFGLGSMRLVLEYQYEALLRLAKNTVVMIIVTVVVMVVVLLQYLLLGQQLRAMLSQNLGMEAVVNRLQTFCNESLRARQAATTSVSNKTLNN